MSVTKRELNIRIVWMLLTLAVVLFIQGDHYGFGNHLAMNSLAAGFAIVATILLSIEFIARRNEVVAFLAVLNFIISCGKLLDVFTILVSDHAQHLTYLQY